MPAPSSSPVNRRQHHSYPAHPMIQRSQYHQKCPGPPALPGAGLWRGAASRCAIVIGSVVDGRDVAQFGSALDWGSRGRRFKSGRPDWFFEYLYPELGTKIAHMGTITAA